MKKINIFIDIIAFVTFLVSLFSGFILWGVIPRGSGFQGGRGLENISFFGLFRHGWMSIHFFSSLFLALIIIIHLILHWKWIKLIPQMIKEK